MGHKYADIMFSEPVKATQLEQGSREIYARLESRQDFNDRLTVREASFINQRDSFYMASVNPEGWPYIQHRGGPAGFVRVLDEKHIGFADYSGNRQYINTGNLRANNRLSLFFMDYANRRRLKMIGLAREVDLGEPELVQLTDINYPAKIERGFIIEVSGFDWNCPQHITPRYGKSSKP